MGQYDYSGGRTPTLEDLLGGTYSGGPPPEAPPIALESPSSGGLSSTERRKLVDLLLQPDQVGPAPEAPVKGWQAAIGGGLSALGDALNAYVAGQSGNPGMRSDFAGKFQENRSRKAQGLQQYLQQKAEAATRAKQRTANYLLSESDKQQMRQDAQAGKLELQANQLAQRKADEAQRVVEAAARIDLQKTEIDSRERIAKMESDARERVASAERGLHALRMKGEGDKDQHKIFVEAKGAIIAKKREYDVLLAEGKITPEQIASEWEDIKSALDLDPSGPYAAAVDVFFKRQMNPIIMKNGPKYGPENAPPTPTDWGKVGTSLSQHGP